MKLGPRQFVGLAAIVFFGGVLVWTLAKPKPDPMMTRSGVSLRDLPSPPTPDTSSLMTVTLAEDPLTIGSDAAKDDLYCSGVIFAARKAARKTAGDKPSPDDATRHDHLLALAEAGIGKLIGEGAATRETTAAIADAQANHAEDDMQAGTPRIPLADCTARAEDLPKAAPPPG